jgi:phosphate starvation-inducible protein PhoH and related proteins
MSTLDNRFRFRRANTSIAHVKINRTVEFAARRGLTFERSKASVKRGSKRRGRFVSWNRQPIREMVDVEEHQARYISRSPERRVRYSSQPPRADRTQLRPRSIEYYRPPVHYGQCYIPRTENQRRYHEMLEDENIDVVLGIGPAGSGKTLFACQAAARAYQNRSIDAIIITRPAVTTCEDLGALPGDQDQKMLPFVQPVLDNLAECLAQGGFSVERMRKEKDIVILPLGTMRGHTFKRVYVIADEMQNSTPIQMKMALTRLGVGSRMFVTGDLTQSDFRIRNGLEDLKQKMECNPEFNGPDATRSKIQCVKLDDDDVQRSELVSQVLRLYS